MMMNKNYNSIEDLLFDKSFRDWILYRTDTNNFWEEWLKNSPEKSDIVNYAKAILYTLSVRNTEISEEEIQVEINKVLNEIDKDGSSDELLLVSDGGILIKKPIKLKRRLAVAMLGITILLVAGYMIRERYVGIQSTDTLSQVSKTGAANLAFVDQYNKSDTAADVLLPDGSHVQLSPASKLRFEKNNFLSNREISLEGEAFFDVQKDAAHPFIVNTKSMVTKVLGTSFIVKEFNTDKTASVIVKTGRVSVSKLKDFTENDKHSEQLPGIILTPNQQLIYTIADNDLNKSIIEKPLILPKIKSIFNFNNTPVKDVFETLEKAYGISIIYDNDQVSGKTLSASFGEEDFYQKLIILCKAINASYEIIDGSVVINFKN